MAAILSRDELRAKALQRLLMRGHATIPQAAELVGVHHHTLRAMIARGEVRTINIGHRKYVTQSEINRLKSGGTNSDDEYSAFQIREEEEAINELLDEDPELD